VPYGRSADERQGRHRWPPCDAQIRMRASPCKPSRLYLGAGVPYEPRVRILGAAFLLITGPLMLLVPSVTEAQKKKVEYLKGPVGKAAAPCGARILPLIEGNKWTYGFIASPVPPRDDLVKLLPSQPSQVVITVKSVETKGPDTVATLEEKTSADLSKDPKKHIMDERTITSTITCNRTKFEISPESFFFAGEPGGYFGLTLDKIDRARDTTWKLVNGSIGDSEWREDLVIHFTRTSVPGSGAKLDSGKLELERKFTPAQPENINTKPGVYTAEKLAITTTGRVTLDNPSQPDAKTMELPANWVNQLWIAPNVGVIQALNSYSHMYQLTEVQLK
jgi:hypothetical protein